RFDSVICAEYLLAIAYSRSIVLNITKVQKLLYLAYGAYLAEYDKSFITEQPKAWPYGPVFPRTRKHVNFDNVLSLDNPKFDKIKKNEEITLLFNKIIDNYSNFTASQLSEWSHEKDGPWDKTVKNSNGNWNVPIDDELIKKYFLNLKI
ncbi:Panacea domain-containing protein, partial [Riemerella columbipharyngis]